MFVCDFGWDRSMELLVECHYNWHKPHTHTHTHTYIYIYMSVCSIYIYIYIIYVYIYICVCVCMCVCVSRKIDRLASLLNGASNFVGCLKPNIST